MCVYFLGVFFFPPDKVPILEKKKLPVVGIGKHLCGAATGMNSLCANGKKLGY